MGFTSAQQLLLLYGLHPHLHKFFVPFVKDSAVDGMPAANLGNGRLPTKGLHHNEYFLFRGKYPPGFAANLFNEAFGGLFSIRFHTI
jgi:hypothetical protein